MAIQNRVAQLIRLFSFGTIRLDNSPRILGRYTAGGGAAQEIKLGDNLSLDGDTLNATGGNAPVDSVNGQIGAVSLGIADIPGLQSDLTGKVESVTVANMAALGALGSDSSARVAFVSDQSNGANFYYIAPSASGGAAVLMAPNFTGITGKPASITAIAALTPAADKFLYYTGSSAAALSTITAFARSVLNASDAASTRNVIGLGNVDNTSDSAKPVSSATQTALNLKANLASPSLSGVPTAPTASTDTATAQIATTSFVVSQIAASLTAESTGGNGAADAGKSAIYDGNGTLTSSYGLYVKDPGAGFKVRFGADDDTLTADRTQLSPDRSGVSVLTENGSGYAGTGELICSSTNDSASAGKLGEVIANSVVAGSAVSLTTATTANVTSISLTAGDWDVSGVVHHKTTGSTSTKQSCAIGTTSATLSTSPGQFDDSYWTQTIGNNTYTNKVPKMRISLAATTTVYLTAQHTFSAGSVAAYGNITARRAR